MTFRLYESTYFVFLLGIWIHTYTHIYIIIILVYLILPSKCFLSDENGCMPYDLTFNWNIINRRKNKQNIMRDIEVKNNLTIARGEGGRDSGEKGFQELL